MLVLGDRLGRWERFPPPRRVSRERIGDQVSTYRVYGTLAGREIDSVVDAVTGAAAYLLACEPHFPRFKGKDWRRQRTLWLQENARLNVEQIDPQTLKHR